MTLQQIRAQVRLLINQADNIGDFSNSELNGFINEGVRFLASLVKWPRDRVEVQVEVDTPAYTLPVDTILILNAYFGSSAITDDIRPLRILTEEKLKELRPNWMDNTASSQGRPDTVILLDRKTVVINPRPNTAESASGKKLEIVYVFYPPTLTADGDTPELPIIYHDLASQYATHKCYMSKLNDPVIGQGILRELMDKAKILEPVVTKEYEPLQFSWGNDDNLGSYSDDFTLRVG